MWGWLFLPNSWVFKRHDITRSREYLTFYNALSKSIIVIYGRRVANSYGFWEDQTTEEF